MLHNIALKWLKGSITTCSTNDRSIKTAESGDIVLKECNNRCVSAKQYAESVLQNGIGKHQINNIHFCLFLMFLKACIK